MRLDANVKVLLAGVAITIAVGLVIDRPDIKEGTGLIIATLAAGAGYLFKEISAEERARQNICQSYAAFIEAQFCEIEPSLCHEELERFLKLAPLIRSGVESESIGIRLEDPFEDLPNIKENIHIFGEDTLSILYKWRTESNNMIGIYDFIGSKAMAAFSHDRLRSFFNTVDEMRDEYRDTGYTALLHLKRDSPWININVKAHLKAGAKRREP